MSTVTIQGKPYGPNDQIPFKYSEFEPYDRTSAQARFPPHTNKWKHTGIHKDHSPSVVEQMKKFASHLPFSPDYWKIRANNKALDEYKKWQKHNPNATDAEKTARLDQYNAALKKGGKKRSRKYRKSSKSKSRKNRKTRSRK